MDFVKKSMLIGVGLATLTREKVEQTINELIEKGEMSEKEGKDAVDDLMKKSKEVTKGLTEKVEKTVTDTLNKLNIPTRKEFAELKEKIKQMEKSRGSKE
jgi:poly(hydroxyalkanoate) granule-associated protein